MVERMTRCFGKYILRYTFPGWVDSSNEDQVILLKRLFLRHLLQLRCNSHAISEISCELEESDGSGSDKGRGGIETVREMMIGSVILPTASLMNHSCSPNAIFR